MFKRKREGHSQSYRPRRRTRCLHWSLFGTVCTSKLCGGGPIMGDLWPLKGLIKEGKEIPQVPWFYVESTLLGHGGCSYHGHCAGEWRWKAPRLAGFCWYRLPSCHQLNHQFVEEDNAGNAATALWLVSLLKQRFSGMVDGVSRKQLFWYHQN